MLIHLSIELTRTQELERFWAPILQSFAAGETVLPPYLGLGNAGFEALITDLAASHIELYILPGQHKTPIRQVRQDIVNLRQSELQELVSLLMENANPSACYARFAAMIIACGCLGNRHLWKDLGLPERPRLSQIFAWYFPAIFSGNDRNMRWKRYLYKQLCETGGDYVCRAPSCDQCNTYQECFGPET
ncbi:nitrogen fixation protein NifQ [Shewanella avicenniae]|uniref:Nitrogen fixation protein NifQ n=1 Tax=Shewanella avicenniae TaxID=2814294 RepID=A0ABX7QT48_9GAMM|nr:nitrogen fixation protein NifQ [Shewanella avicenniae]QSX34192.1 nitrogen fixation protein NifQ [Shewanella avicenniae]